MGGGEHSAQVGINIGQVKPTERCVLRTWQLSERRVQESEQHQVFLRPPSLAQQEAQGWQVAAQGRGGRSRWGAFLGDLRQSPHYGECQQNGRFCRPQFVAQTDADAEERGGLLPRLHTVGRLRSNLNMEAKLHILSQIRIHISVCKALPLASPPLPS